MTLRFVTTDGSGRWTGGGAPLPPGHVDENFWTLKDLIDNIALAEAVSISDITQSGNNLYIELTDNSVLGPFSLPVSKLNSRGQWQASALYAVNDTFYYGASIYVVNIGHTADTVFNPGATNGGGLFLYSMMITVPAASLPTGGAKGSILAKKTTATDFDTEWSKSIELPVYGAVNVSGSVTINKANGECQRLNLTGNITAISTLNFGLAGQMSKITLEIWGADTHTIVWPAAWLWEGGIVPTPGAKMVIVIFTMDGGTTVYANIVGQDYKVAP